ncbi:MAG: hypothetical protein L3K10_04620 [Thermoplasmata archaeon]|nr:hypothetical protein [Thermoplasmata archaeon]
MAVLVVLGGSGLTALAVPGLHSTGPATASTVPADQPAAVTHGDLVVGPGQIFTIQPTLGGRTYYQGGNVTVEVGGTLVVENVTLSFVQFVADVGSAQSRLSHVVHFLDQGTVQVYNSTITTDINILNAYAKLNVTVTGTFTAWNSQFEFPGWVSVHGVGAALTLNNSVVSNNPGIAGLTEPSVIRGDSSYAASFNASGGGQINLFETTLNATYADNFEQNGLPTIAPLFQTNVTGVVNVTNLYTPTGSANLTTDWLNPGFVAAGNVSIWYNTTNPPSPSFSVPVTVWYEGIAYPVGSVSGTGSTAAGFSSTPFSPALLAAINAGGVLTYLNNTGAFGSASQISVAFGGSGAQFSTVRVALLPSLEYNLVGSGAGTTINTVDSNLDLSWFGTHASPWSIAGPFPWNSNKLVLTGGAAAYLANLSVPNPITGVFSTSAIVPDASSTAYLFRWADLNLTGKGGVVPIYGATEHAFYAYGAGQANNATVTSLNNLPASSPAIWGYVQYRDHQLGYPGYGVSGRGGIVSLLLASSVVSGANLPDGNFVGTYHMGLILPIGGKNSNWFNWSVSPYPDGVALGSAGYLGPDFGPDQHFPQYFAGAVIVGAPTVTANGSAAPRAGVRIGQVIGFETTINSTGPAPITSLAASLLWGNATAKKVIGGFYTGSLDLTTPGQTFTFTLTWLINDSVTELNGSQSRAFTVLLTWNPGNATGLSGTAYSTENVTVLPSQIVIASFQAPPTTLDVNQQYFSDGIVHYNGTQQATITLIATPTSGGGAAVVIALGQALPGEFTLTWYPLQQLLSAGTTYTLEAVATYNKASFNYSLPGTYSVPGSTSPTSFLTQTFFGLPLWLWLAIAAGVALAIVAVLVVLRRQAAGKVVECGECGNLIPEEATVCPKCGAEFEADLVRCSRCASTIPSNSVVCPECAAQLLGVPGSAPEEAERQGYQDFTEKYRAEGKKELGENYNEGSFWDWWKRQPTYVSYSQWKLQQGQGSPRTGMSEPPASSPAVPLISVRTPTPAPAARTVPPAATTPPAAAPRVPPKSPVAAAPAAPPTAAGGLKSCPSCGKEIPGDYLVCPFCGSVTQ